MMDALDARQWLLRFRIGDPIKTLFKPQFDVDRDLIPGLLQLILRVQAPDADGTRGVITVTLLRALNPDIDMKRLHLLMRQMLHEILMHEADESIYVDDVKAFDPHTHTEEGCVRIVDSGPICMRAKWTELTAPRLPPPATRPT